MGFEPTRAEHNGLAGHRLNHSAKVSQEWKHHIDQNYTGKNTIVLPGAGQCPGYADSFFVFLRKR